MFRYMITPSNGTTPVVLAFTVSNDTVTGYIGLKNNLEDIPYIGGFFSSHYASFNSVRHFIFCIHDYQQQPDEKVSFWQEHDDIHATMHSPDRGETQVAHWHLKHTKPITTDLLKKFLNHLKKCEEVKQLENGETFFTHTVRKDIIKKYSDYETKNLPLYTGSNNPCYTNKTMPTIAQHTRRLGYSNVTNCLPSTSSTTEEPTQLSTQSSWGFIGLNSLLLMCAAGTLFGFFSQKTPAKKETSQPQVSQKKPMVKKRS